MGRELQKRKNRSSVAKNKQKPKSKKKLLHHPVIAANWDQKATLSQNYRRLGLASRLNHPTGGTEKSAVILQEDAVKTGQNALSIKSKLPTKIDITEVQIERDPKTGAITRVIDDGARRPNPLNDPLNDLEDSDDEGWQGFVNEHGVVDGAATSTGGTTVVVRELEAEAAQSAPKKIRKQSEREEQWIADLVEKYGDEYGKMSRDMKLNPMQQSSGDIKRRVKKWRASRVEEA